MSPPVSPVPPVSAVADVCALFGRDGWLTPPLQPFVGAARPLSGRAVTVQLGPADPTAPGAPLAALYELLSKDMVGSVLVIAGGLPVQGAVWGEILSRAARRHGAIAVLVDGAVRDRPGCLEQGLPVYASEERVVGPAGRATVRAQDVEVEIGGVTVRPGDTVVVDASGAVRLPADHAEPILAAAAAYAEGEQRVLDALDRSEPLMSAIGEKTAAVAALREQLSSADG